MKTTIRKPSLYFNLAVIFFIIGWFLVGLAVYFCRATQYTMDAVLIWFLLAAGLMGNVYATVLVGMARAPKVTSSSARARVIIHGRSKWLDDSSNITENGMSER